VEDTTCTETESIISSRQGKCDVTFHNPKFVIDVFVIVNVVYVLCICVHKGTKFNTFVYTGIALSCEWMVYN